MIKKIKRINKTIGIIMIFMLLFMAGCNGKSDYTSNIDLSGMDESAIYDEYTTDSVTVLDGRVYYCHELEDTSYPQVQILRCDAGKSTVIFEGRITDVKAYANWLYYNDWDYYERAALWRIDLLSGKTEKILEKEVKYTVCPAGIFWISNESRSIRHANLDGSNVSTLFELEEKNDRLIGGLSIFQHSLYFLTNTPASPQYNTEYSRLNLVTNTIENPKELNIQKTKKNISQVSEWVHEVVDIDPIELSLHEAAGGFFAAENGWMYYLSTLLWFDPKTKLFEPNGEPGYVCKIKEDGSQKATLFTKPESGRYVAARDGWIYVWNRSENGGAIYRITEDGSETQTIIGESCKYKDCIDGYLYYSLLYDKDSKPLQDNLYRLNMDSLGGPERLY